MVYAILVRSQVFTPDEPICYPKWFLQPHEVPFVPLHESYMWPWMPMPSNKTHSDPAQLCLRLSHHACHGKFFCPNFLCEGTVQIPISVPPLEPFNPESLWWLGQATAQSDSSCRRWAHSSVGGIGNFYFRFTSLLFSIKFFYIVFTYLVSFANS